MGTLIVYGLIVVAALVLGGALSFRRDLNGRRLLGLATTATAVGSVGIVIAWFNGACWETWQPCGAEVGTALMASVALSTAGAIACAITLARH